MWAKITIIISMIAHAATSSGLILTPLASSWKNLIRPALDMGMGVELSLFLRLKP